MHFRPVGAFEYARTVALLSIAGPIPESTRWGRRVIARGLRVGIRCAGTGADTRAKSLLGIIAKAAPGLVCAQIFRGSCRSRRLRYGFG
jgi:hypothetical protein